MKSEARRPSMRLRHLQGLAPRDPRELRLLVQRLWGLRVVERVMSPGSTPPLAYLSHTFFEEGVGDSVGGTGSRDAVVWANRGGGKTMLGAVATLLDLMFKPGIEVRVLGGSLEQASKMHGHLLRLLDHESMRGVLATAPTARRVVLDNGSRVEVLAGSQRSVRGVRMHKLRCDEVEELDPAVWEAAQLTTRSGWCGGVYVRGAVEALSTMHRPGGLMARLVGKGDEGDATDGGDQDLEGHREEQERHQEANGLAGVAKRFVWNAIDVAARCPDALLCKGCVLWDDCGGRAKRAAGFVPVTDLMQQWRRSSSVAWSAEMMCRRPGVAHAVFSTFDSDRHVEAFDHEGLTSAETLPSGSGFRGRDHSPWVAGMDFGLRCPTVVLWAVTEGEGEASVLRVVAEYDATDRTLAGNLEAMRGLRSELRLPTADRLRWLAIDPAGNARNAHSGRSDAAVLRAAGFRVWSRASGIAEGIEAVRRRLDHGRLVIHPRCRKLISAMQSYHFDAQRPSVAAPVKDGPDHWCDALRYLVMALDRPGKVEARGYL